MLKFLRPEGESNSRIGVLQTPALPLGYQAINSKISERDPDFFIVIYNSASGQTAALPLRHCATAPKLYFNIADLQLNFPASIQLKKHRRQKLHPRFRHKIIFENGILFVETGQNFPLFI